MGQNNIKYIVGAYATAPSLGSDNHSSEREFYQKLIKDIPEIRGLEIPFGGDDIHPFGSMFLMELMLAEWSNVLTCIPATMTALTKMKTFGLASDDDQGRAAAIAMHKRANEMLHKINDNFGRQSIIAVQVATAPSTPVDGVSSSLKSLLYSMNEILKWDWGGVKIVIEHCDTSIAGQAFEKGFISLDKELEVLEELSKDNNLGVTINWARSAIEGRSTDKPIEHLKLALGKNLLSGLMFSGVSKSDEQYGKWKDSHMPFGQSYGIANFEKNSLLTLENIKSCLSLIDIGKLDYLGVKLLAMPIGDSTIDRRVGVNRDAITILNHLIA